MGRGTPTKELLNLPLAGLERRCKHNGLPLGGGREMMDFRLLYLEEDEKQRGYELDDDSKYPWSQSILDRYSSGPHKPNVEVEPMGL